MENNQGTTGVLTRELQALTAEEQTSLTRILRYLHKHHDIGDGKNGQLQRARLLTLENFLSSEDLAAVLEYTLGHEADFKTSKVQGESMDSDKIDANVRRSCILDMLDERYDNLIVRRVLSALPDVLHRLGRPPFAVGSIETQITASNDGEFFKIHCDAGHSITTQDRELTFVYYFNHEPKAFTGGELHVYDTILVDDHPIATTSFQTVVPHQNQIVFFPSFLMHEVLPVNCPSRQFADSRFTINGWLHPAEKDSH